MTRRRRLAKLEADTLERWHKAWELSAVIFDRHTSKIAVNATDLLKRLEVERPDLSSDDIEAEGVAFLESLGVRQYREFEAWFKSYELPEDDPPDLSMWPSDIPTPPDELPGEWNKAAPFMASEDVVRRLAAQIFCFLLAMARATREEQAR